MHSNRWDHIIGRVCDEWIDLAGMAASPAPADLTDVSQWLMGGTSACRMSMEVRVPAPGEIAASSHGRFNHDMFKGAVPMVVVPNGRGSEEVPTEVSRGEAVMSSQWCDIDNQVASVSSFVIRVQSILRNDVQRKVPRGSQPNNGGGSNIVARFFVSR